MLFADDIVLVGEIVQRWLVKWQKKLENKRLKICDLFCDFGA